MENLSVTVIKMRLSISVFSQTSFTRIYRDHHIHMHPHYLMTPLISVGSSFSFGGSVDEATVTTTSPASRTEYTIPRSSGNYFILVRVHLFGVFITRGRFECL